MNDLLSKQYSLATIKNILSLHVFADYFGAKKLHQITKSSTTTSSLFQATGEAAGISGYVNITDMKGGKVGFTPVDNEGSDGGDRRPMAMFVKSVDEMPYTISVIQISRILSSPEAEAPTDSPADLNVTTLMASKGCQGFSDLITAQPGVEDTFKQSVEGGLTVFCPSDDALTSFAPKFRNLSGDDKASLILFHAIPEYNSLGTLRSSNGLMNTLATEGAKKKYDFTVQNDGNDVKLETKVVTATILGTLVEEDPLAVFKIDKVLLPREMFRAAAPAPAPKASKSRSSDSTGDDADSPGTSGDDDDGTVADATSSNDAGRVYGGGFAAVWFGLAFAVFAGAF